MNPKEITLLRMMAPQDRMRPNGYFYGPAGVYPNGDVSIEMLKQSPTYPENGEIKIFYKYLEETTPLRPWRLAKTDTFHFNFGPKDH
ncbi:hypothetical protein [Chitinophaga barathri]|uniref:Uncharacterized protein n=1 Tax=Chitinophaga barathri TaxID=1647451 RepID=A0A3N4MI05_9BACT|nr:hypothetical protein [Chitinophaga barathri]RPD43065.1 hypothetical protein EG028_01880 [Chitinophaga barathri]